MSRATDEFLAPWRRFVALWRSEREADPARAQRLVDRALSEGLFAGDLPADEAGEPDHDALLDCEFAVIRRSGYLDREAYVRATPQAADFEGGPVRHFCIQGWRWL